ncbi:MAG: LysR family transcriptional regulator [Pelagibacteraceae bacterium]|jgi:DNA-binding transcriptional LysR family regulator|nr:LysR family transcriptional regulator [Pelagibacteraceae bacterium]MBT5011457.1 LysR family transcriptional regulator [Flavobacteriaceae bacterium]MBT4645683.1 LysR family transcriptional regulator [Pelagibacteraceae bacterium]MBT5213366.1 LysR family transcriptional regulator [Pelagibacteraceae bacterium]MBT6197306.1 LysR family transcriptional regulator [Pelagibacteraceae bacterium]
MHSIEYRYFYQSALDSSIRKASQTLNINSSAIVRQIQKLEDKLQTKLFIRNARGLDLTNEGKLLFDHLAVQNEINQNFLSDLKQNKSSTKGEINISTGETFAVQFLSPIISKFRKKYPDVKIKISSRQPEAIIDNLITNKTDFGISFAKNIPKTLKAVYLCNFPMGVLCSPTHLLANKSEILLEDCLKFPLIFHPGTVTFWNSIQREVGEKLFSINPNLISNSFAFIKNYLIDDNNSLTFFTSVGSVKEIESKKLIFKKINHKLFLNNKVGILVSKKNKLNNYTKDFIEYVITEFENSGNSNNCQ